MRVESGGGVERAQATQVVESLRGRAGESPLALAHGAAATPQGPGGGRVDMEAVVARVAALGDPITMMMAAQSELRIQMGTGQQSDIIARKNETDRAHLAQKKALEAAEKAAQKSGLLRGPLGKLLKWIAAAAAAVATPFTGGASTALMVAGVALMLTGEHIAKGLAKAGVISDKAAKWLGMGLQLVGAAMTMGAGIAGSAASTGASAANTASQTASAASQTASTAGQVGSTAGQAVGQGAQLSTTARSVQDLAKVVENTTKVAKALNDTAASVHEYHHVQRMADADAAGIDIGGATAGMDEAAEAMREVFERFARITEHLREAAEAQQEARQAALQLLA